MIPRARTGEWLTRDVHLFHSLRWLLVRTLPIKRRLSFNFFLLIKPSCYPLILTIVFEQSNLCLIDVLIFCFFFFFFFLVERFLESLNQNRKRANLIETMLLPLSQPENSWNIRLQRTTFLLSVRKRVRKRVQTVFFGFGQHSASTV